MFAKRIQNETRLEARHISCEHCGYEARTSLRMRRPEDKATPTARRACPRCNAPVDIVSRDDDHARFTASLSRATLLSRPLYIPSRMERWWKEARAGITTLAVMGVLALLTAPAMARALTHAVDQEIQSRNFASSPEECDALIRAYRAAPGDSPVWDELHQACPARRDAIADLRHFRD